MIAHLLVVLSRFLPAFAVALLFPPALDRLRNNHRSVGLADSLCPNAYGSCALEIPQVATFPLAFESNSTT